MTAQASLRLLLALVCGGAGGAMFWILSLPLPWMLGAIVGSMTVALLGAPVATPRFVKPPLSAIIGTMLSAGFSTDLFARGVEWFVPLSILFVYTALAGSICVAYFYKVCRYDFRTAYFCGMPGGLSEMTLLGDALGGDARRISMSHSARVMLVVFSVTAAARLLVWLDDGAIAADPVVGAQVALTLETVVWMLVTCAVGVFLGTLLRLPARFLLGPLFLSALIHVAGIDDFEIPRYLVSAAQVGLGTTIGCRFVGQRAAEVGKIFLYGLGSTTLLMALTFLFAFIGHTITGINVMHLALAYSPGGLPEMGFVAIYLGIDIAFISFHHLFRLLLVSFLAGYIFRFFRN